MKMKLLPILIVGMLLFTSVNIIAEELEDNNNTNILTKEQTVTFSKPTIEYKDNFVSLSIAETTNYLTTPEKPMLPYYIKTFKFPFGTKINNVDCIISEVNEEIITGTIKSAPKPQPLISLQNTKVIESESIEESTNYQDLGLYPEKWFDYGVKCGIDKGERYVFVIFHVYPIRYDHSQNKILEIESADLIIDYEPGVNPIPKKRTFDLVIITPRRFLLGVIPLKIHKEIMGISTKIKTTESIYRQYLFKGRDRPEKIKKFIHDAIEDWGITYVLLVGGRNHQRFRYHVPVRYSNLEDRGGWNETYVSDLYYADIYKGDGEFDDWDSNGNNRFAEWTWIWNPEWNWWSNDVKQKDILDLYPDVYVGRLACKNIFEVRNAVKKIRKYERSTYDQEWFKKMICLGGDTAPYGDGIYEGEYENQYAIDFMEPLGFDITRLWASLGTLETPDDTIYEVNNNGSAGFLFFAGHGSPFVWSTHPPDDPGTWIDGLWNFDMRSLKNKGKYPICVVGGCHNSQFDVGLPHMWLGLLKNRLRYFTWLDDKNCFDKMAWIPNTWSWKLVTQRNGGAIAAIGNTGLGWGSIGEGCIEDLDGWITSRFFETYANLQSLENCTLGMVHSETISSYVETFLPNNDELDRKTVEQWVLLGDPSLKIGGYPS